MLFRSQNILGETEVKISGSSDKVEINISNCSFNMADEIKEIILKKINQSYLRL